MGLANRLSIRSKLVFLLLATSIVSILIIAWQGYQSAREAMAEATYNQLNTLRSAKVQQIDSYFSNISHQVQGFANNRVIVDAVNEFRTAFHLANRESITEEQQKSVENFYRKEFIPRLKNRIGGEHEVKHFIPKTAATSYLQYHYMVDNPNKIGEKDSLVKAEKDGSYFAQVHERYHESLQSLIKQFGYYDLFLIDHETGDIVYSVFKEIDFATNLYDGAFSSSNFSRLIKTVNDNKLRNKAKFQDFDLYMPSYGSPAAFAAITIYDGLEVAGILAVQMPISELNNVMTGNRSWEKSGMGESGEVFVAGRNRLMRSDSRFLEQHRERYLKRLKDIGTPEKTIRRIDKLNTTILFQPITGEAVDRAFSGHTGTSQVIDYRGVPVISSYAPLRTHGLDWAILAEMDVDEVNQPVDKFRRKVMVYASVLGIIITLLALVVANYFTRPLHVLVAALRRVGQGETDVHVDIVGEDEVGVLSKSFNSMMEGIREQKELINEKDLENKLLLHNILPEQIAERMIAGEDPIADQVPNVSVIFVTLTGLDDSDDSPDVAIVKLNKLITEFDAAAEEAGVDKIKTIGDDYMAACGLLTPRLDHSKRAMEFSRQLISIAQRLSQEFNRPLELSVGIHSGTVLAGVIGEKKFVYDIWGETVNIADAIRSHAEPNSILISNNTYENLANQDKYKKAKMISSGGTVELQSWQFIGETNDI